MPENFALGFIKQPLKTIRRSYIRFFGSTLAQGDKSLFDARGAITIRAGEKSVSEATGGQSSSMTIDRPTGSKFIDAAKAMQAHYGWVYACTKAISDEMANIKWSVFQYNDKGEKEEIFDNDLLDFLEGVNESQTGPEFRKILSSHLELTGNAYIFLKDVKDFDSQPKSMYLLNPGRVGVIMNKTTFPYTLIGYTLKQDNREFKFKPHEIVHLKYPDPNDVVTGLGTVQGIGEWIDNDNYAMEYNRNFFRNGARMSGVFETDMTSIEQTQRLKIAFEEQFAGIQNAYKSMIMPKGVKWVATQVSAKDMDFANLLDTTGARILAGFRVSKTILGTAESETNRSTAETADYVFARRTIKPKMEMIVSYLNEFLAPRFGDNLEIGFIDPVPEDKLTRTQEAHIAVGGKQIITQNEARAQLGLTPIDSEDADSIDSGSGNIMDFPSGDGSEPDDTKSSKKKMLARPKKKSAGKTKTIKYKTQFSRNKDRRKSLAADLAKSVAKFISEAKKKNLVEMSDEEYVATIYPSMKARIDDYSEKIKTEFQKINREQEKEVLENLSSAIKDVTPSKLFDIEKWFGITVDLITPLFEKLYFEEGQSAGRNIGKPDTDLLVATGPKKAIDKRIALLSRSYNESARDLLTAKLNEGIAAGLPLENLKESIKDVYSFQNDIAAERVARTEVTAVSNMANKEAWREAGTVKTVRWYTSEQDSVCPFCDDMKGEVIDIDEDFWDKHDVMELEDGKTLKFDYSAVGGPPLHPNCNCFIRPDSFTPISASAPELDPLEVAEALATIKKLGDEK